MQCIYIYTHIMHRFMWQWIKTQIPRITGISKQFNNSLCSFSRSSALTHPLNLAVALLLDGAAANLRSNSSAVKKVGCWCSHTW